MFESVLAGPTFPHGTNVLVHRINARLSLFLVYL